MNTVEHFRAAPSLGRAGNAGGKALERAGRIYAVVSSWAVM